MDHRIDLYLNGHEHDLEYAYYPYDSYDLRENLSSVEFNGFTCEDNVEYIFKDEPHSEMYSSEEIAEDASTRKKVFYKGEAIHQITTGTTGFDLYPICIDRPSMGRWKYASNQYHGFTQVHADVDHISLKIKGVDEKTKEIKQLYEIEIKNEPRP